jgi:hypothetical protein
MSHDGAGNGQQGTVDCLASTINRHGSNGEL